MSSCNSFSDNMKYTASAGLVSSNDRLYSENSAVSLPLYSPYSRSCVTGSSLSNDKQYYDDLMLPNLYNQTGGSSEVKSPLISPLYNHNVSTCVLPTRNTYSNSKNLTYTSSSAGILPLQFIESLRTWFLRNKEYLQQSNYGDKNFFQNILDTLSCKYSDDLTYFYNYPELNDTSTYTTNNKLLKPCSYENREIDSNYSKVSNSYPYVTRSYDCGVIPLWSEILNKEFSSVHDKTVTSLNINNKGQTKIVSSSTAKIASLETVSYKKHDLMTGNPEICVDKETLMNNPQNDLGNEQTHNSNNNETVNLENDYIDVCGIYDVDEGDIDIVGFESSENEMGGEQSHNTQSNQDADNNVNCFICNCRSSAATFATEFIRASHKFPLMLHSKSPLLWKLMNILPKHLEYIVINVKYAFICSKCLNLLEVVEQLEIKLTKAKENITTQFVSTAINNNHRINHDGFNDYPQTSINDPIASNTADILYNIYDKKNWSDKNNKLDTETNCNNSDSGHTNNESNVNDNHNILFINELVDVGQDHTLVQDKVDVNCDQEKELKCPDKSSVDEKQVSTSQTENNEPKSQIKTKSSYLCARCGKSFVSQMKLTTHVLMHENKYRFQCDVCGKLFRQNNHFRDHLMEHGALSYKDRYTCERCGKHFLQKILLTRHCRIHIEEYRCEKCGKVFNTRWNLGNHQNLCVNGILRKYNNSNIRALQTKDLRNSISKNERLYECTKCGKSFKCVSNLNQHMKQHAGSRFKCEICQKEFVRHNQFTLHLLSHCETTLFICNVCNKRFLTEEQLKLHKLIHSESSKLRTCSVCGKKIKHNLKVHMRTHTNEKPFQCPHCDLAFTVKCSLKKHLKLKHT